MQYEQTVETHKGTVTVRKLKIMEYANVLRELKTIPAKFGAIAGGEDLTNDKLIQLAPEVISESLPEVCKIFSMASDQDAVFFEDLYLDELVDVFVALYQINDFNKVADSVKKLTARKAQ